MSLGITQEAINQALRQSKWVVIQRCRWGEQIVGLHHRRRDARADAGRRTGARVERNHR